MIRFKIIILSALLILSSANLFAGSNTQTDINPLVNNSIPESLDFIFDTNSMGTTTLTIRRSEWNKMLSYFDYFHKNENSVKLESYEYKKKGKNWKLYDTTIRLRGNTSRFRPQGKDYPKDKTGNLKNNAEWSKPYYDYAAKCSDDAYRQSHFKINFAAGINKGRRLSDCMEGVGLKRCDSSFSREIFCYYLFHQYGIWTAPRASLTKVYIIFIEDLNEDNTAKEDISGCSKTKIDFGVYEMFEEVGKQSLKARMKENSNNLEQTAWVNDDGDLWKCSGDAGLNSRSNKKSNIGCEEMKILNTDKPQKQWKAVWNSPSYDLKTNKSKVDSATINLQNFMTELNKLSSISKKTEKGIQARKDFYEKWFDVDFFIKTYAVIMLVGMDDDYWGNANNYYLYFDNAKDGSKKCYMIPFDFDNTLGCSITDDKVVTNPLNWGNGKDRPLMDRLLEVPEYKQKLITALLEVSSQDSSSPWNKNNCYNLWKKWNKMAEPYTLSSNLQNWPDINTMYVYDNGGWKEKRHYLTDTVSESDNIYEQTFLNFQYWLKEKQR